MAFQIKKDLHLNTGIYLKLLDDPINAKTEEDIFGNTKYTIPIEMAGHDIQDGSGVKWFKNALGQWIELKLGKQTDFEFSGALYKKLVGNSSGSTESSNKPQKAVSNASLGITWGMSINNATQLMIAKGLDEKTDIIDELEYTASKIMDVAVNGLARWEEVQHKKDQNSAPNDDLPF